MTKTLPEWGSEFCVILMREYSEHHQTDWYGRFAKRTGYNSAHSIGRVLDFIMTWCAVEHHPPLTSLLVDQDTGMPSDGLVTVRNNDFPRAQQAVYRHDWRKLYIPNEYELRRSHDVYYSLSDEEKDALKF